MQNLGINLENLVNKTLNEKMEIIENNPELSNLMSVFRTNFDAFEKLLDFYKQNVRYRKHNNESGMNEIKKILVNAQIIKSVDDITDNFISQCLTRIREEKGTKTKIKRGGENSNFQSALNAVAPQEGKEVKVGKGVTPTVTPPSQRDWLDPQWLDEEPDWKQWSVEKKKPLPGEWSDEWENMWRHLLKIADERGFNEFQKTHYEGYKQLGSVFADLWLAMNRSRRDLRDQYGWDAYGVGRKQ